MVYSHLYILQNLLENIVSEYSAVIYRSLAD